MSEIFIALMVSGVLVGGVLLSATLFGRPYFVWRQLKLRKAVPGCAMGEFCRPDMRHGKCERCGVYTDSYTVIVDSHSRRRRKAYSCTTCPEPARQEELRRIRALADWSLLLPDQFPGITRSVIHKVYAGNIDNVLIPDVRPAQLQASIEALGLSGDMYAEQRGSETYLRKVV